AVGDVVEVEDVVSGTPTQIPLAGPANRQGRIAADHCAGRDSRYRGTQGTAIVGLFGKTAAMTGLSEKTLQRLGLPYEKIYIHPTHHAGYYPGAEALTLKLLFDPTTGKVLGAQCVGGLGVDKRIDVLAVAIQAQMTVFDLEEMELCYAPQFGSAKDPVNMAGFVAAGLLRGDHPIVHAAELATLYESGTQIIDVRTPQEFNQGHVPNALNIEVDQLRRRLPEIENQRPVVCYCQVGMRGYLATTILRQRGFSARNLSGGYTSYRQWLS
ncbi:MAG: rhodanese-like domain-containing protein, partial [Planctomycetota bacterium]|nr:rhodanese-like domain-containing protein [Planctomycetota bacterium]